MSNTFLVLSVFKDENTPSPFIEKFPTVEGEGAQAAKPDHIYLDAMGFGMGCSCLQVGAVVKATNITFKGAISPRIRSAPKSFSRHFIFHHKCISSVSFD